MKVKWTPPEKSTIFGPPLTLYYEAEEKKIIVVALAYIAGAYYSIVSLNDVYKDTEQFYIEEPSRRMTQRELMLFMSKGGWMYCIFDVNGYVSRVNTRFDHFSLYILDDTVLDIVKVSRIEKTEWIEPTIDLLNNQTKEEK